MPFPRGTLIAAERVPTPNTLSNHARWNGANRNGLPARYPFAGRQYVSMNLTARAARPFVRHRPHGAGMSHDALGGVPTPIGRVILAALYVRRTEAGYSAVGETVEMESPVGGGASSFRFMRSLQLGQEAIHPWRGSPSTSARRATAVGLECCAASSGAGCGEGELECGSGSAVGCVVARAVGRVGSPWFVAA